MTDSQRIRERTMDFLEEHPDAAERLADLVDLDANAGEWEFDETPLDSGEFGELVSRRIAQETDGDRYSLADRDAVEAALAGESRSDDTDEQPSQSGTESAFNFDVDLGAGLALCATLTFVVVARAMHYSSIFQRGKLVSPANDPYFYRYWQAQLLDRSDGLFDLGLVANLPAGANSRPLTHTFNWWFAELLGGTQGSADMVAAWLPILSAVFQGVFLYLLVKLLTDDVRIAVASVLFLALAPVHAIYTNLGFLEHRLYQYLLLIGMVYALVWLARDFHQRLDSEQRPGRAHATSRQSWLVAGLLAVCVAGSVHAWTGSPLNFIPVALYLALRVLLDVRREIEPLLALGPTLGGLGVGSLLAVFPHLVFGWNQTYIVAIPVLVTLGGVTVGGLGRVWHQKALPAARLFGVQALLAVVGLVGFRLLVPQAASSILGQIDDLLFRAQATETQSLFSTDQMLIFGPLAQIGLGFYIALVSLVGITWLLWRRYEPSWLVVVTFTWVYFLLAAIQIRFAAQLSLFIAVFAGVSLIVLLGKMGLIRQTVLFIDDTGSDTAWPLSGSDKQDGSSDGDSETRVRADTLKLPRNQLRGVYTLGFILFILLFNFIFLPTLSGDLLYSEQEVAAAEAIEEHAETAQRPYPESRVFSTWSFNRMYNYFATGESEGYTYAERHFPEFLESDDPDAYYEQEQNEHGYVVLYDRPIPDETTHAKLFDGHFAGTAPTRHYQAIYLSNTVRAFVVVEGATIVVEGEPGETVTATKTVTVSGISFTYEQQATVDEDGQAELQVSYPGEYELGSETVRVDREAVLRGDRISVGSTR